MVMDVMFKRTHNHIYSKISDNDKKRKNLKKYEKSWQKLKKIEKI